MPILVMLLVAGVVEIGVLVGVGQAIGLLPTLGLLVLAAVLGTWLLRREGRRTLAEMRDAARARRPVDREMSDGVLIAAGGLLIILPGLVSDVAGLLFLFPPTRALVRKRMLRAAERRSKQMQDQLWLHGQRAQREGFGREGFGQAGFGVPRQGGATGSPGATGSSGSAAGRSDVIDGEVVSVTEDDESGSGSGKSGPERSEAPRVLPPDSSAQAGRSEGERRR
ncbi:FxsA family protein [Saccharopolyspora sp. CA-218241]|uniref:FxsA family protein n=1 Tax=Saccharopolyspora sp. CA-218241 TaxID=3240027 RepID=UPI003D993E81